MEEKRLTVTEQDILNSMSRVIIRTIKVNLKEREGVTKSLMFKHLGRLVRDKTLDLLIYFKDDGELKKSYSIPYNQANAKMYSNFTSLKDDLIKQD